MSAEEKTWKKKFSGTISYDRHPETDELIVEYAQGSTGRALLPESLERIFNLKAGDQLRMLCSYGLKGEYHRVLKILGGKRKQALQGLSADDIANPWKPK